MQLANLAHWTVYFVVRVAICIVQAIPIESCHAMARRLAWFFYDVLRVRRRVVDDNLRHAFPQHSDAERDAIGRAMWEHLFLFVAEVAHAPRKIHETNWRDFVAIRDAPRLVRALLDERPLILLSPHFGNFEVGGYVLGVLGFPTYSVARDLDNPYLHRFVNQFRGATGQHIIPKKGGYDEIVEVLSRGGTMALLADQYAGRKGCWVEFFGRPASAHKAIALLALNHNALLAIGYARRLDRPMQFEFVAQSVLDPNSMSDSPDAVRQLTQWYTSEFEAAIRQAPEQYWWVHRRWKDHRRKRTAPNRANVQPPASRAA